MLSTARKKIIASALAIAGMFGIGAALADQGYWPFPILGTPANSVCVTFINGVCSQYQPAGPASTTGNELVPTDTNAPQGQPSQTVRVPITLLNGGAAIYASPLTGTTITDTAQTSKIVLTPAGTIAALTIALPAASGLTDGVMLDVGSSQTVTALTVTAGTGTTVVSAPTTIAANGAFRLIYRASNTSWYVF